MSYAPAFNLLSEKAWSEAENQIRRGGVSRGYVDEHHLVCRSGPAFEAEGKAGK